jgi:O-antigen/teichoic acid export membrane protein
MTGLIGRAFGVVRPIALTTLATPTQRARERGRRFALSAVAAVGARAVAVVVNLVSVPLALATLGPERYGAWVALSSFVLMLSFADLGMGSALLNLVSETDGHDDHSTALHYISSAQVVMALVAASLVVLFALVYPLVDWASMLRVTSASAASEVGPALAVAFVLFALGIPLGIAQRAQLAYQEGFAVSFWQAFGSVAGLIGLVVAIRSSAGLTGVALALAGGVTAGSLANYVAFFGRRPWLRPRLRAFSGRAARLILRRGTLFFALQLATALAFVSDGLIADVVLGPAAATRYSVAQRLYFVVPILITLAVTPLWPAYSEALARGDRRWVQNMFKRSVAGSMLAAALAGTALTILRAPIFSLWVGPELVPSLSLSLALIVWSVLYSWGAAVAVLLNAANVIAFQVVMSLTMGVASVVLKVFFAQHLGIEGIAWAMILAYGGLTFVPYSFYFARRSPLLRE